MLTRVFAAKCVVPVKATPARGVGPKEEQDLWEPAVGPEAAPAVIASPSRARAVGRDMRGVDGCASDAHQRSHFCTILYSAQGTLREGDTPHPEVPAGHSPGRSGSWGEE